MKLLIAAGHTPTEDGAPTGVSVLVDGASEILVVSPSLVGPLKWLTGEVDRARHIASERLDAVLGALGEVDAPTSGVVSDELLTAALDGAIRDFDPDHILIVAAASATSPWRKQRVLEWLLDTYHLPVTVVVARS